jgi:hypothetical protein
MHSAIRGRVEQDSHHTPPRRGSTERNRLSGFAARVLLGRMPVEHHQNENESNKSCNGKRKQNAV